ncbi:MAG: transporter substrate-binding domain-containing protein [Hyphomicrobiales bacterium]
MLSDRLDRRLVLGLAAGSGVAAMTGGPGLPFVAVSPAAAQSAAPPGGSKLYEVLARGHLIVGTGADIPPFYFKDDTGELAGLEIDLARLIARNLFGDPSKLEFIIQNSDARIPNLMSNRIDLVLQNLTVTPARAQQVEFTIPYYRAGQGFLLLASGRYKDYEGLRLAGTGITVSALQNVTAADWVHLALPDAKVDQYPSPDAALQALNAGRADAHMIDYGKVRWTVTQFPSRYADSGYTWKPNSIAVAVRPGDPLWLNWLNIVLREAMTGVDFTEFSGIYKRWMSVDLPAPKLGYPHEFFG